MGLLIWFAYF